MRFPAILYRLLGPIAFVLLVLFKLRRILQKKSMSPQRCIELTGFGKKLPAGSPQGRRVWIQANSIGELNSATACIEALLQREDIELILTVNTAAAYQILRQRYQGRCLKIGFLAADIWPCKAMEWRRFQPDLVCVIENEIWPELLQQAGKHKTPLVLLNARMSPRSFRRYKRLRRWTNWPWCHHAKILTPDAENHQRFLQLSSKPHQVSSIRDLKYDPPTPQPSKQERQQLREQLKLDEDAVVLVGCSTWEGEEACLLEALKAARKLKTKVQLLLAPRHITRCAKIRKLLETEGISYHVHSRKLKPTAPQSPELSRMHHHAPARKASRTAPIHQAETQNKNPNHPPTPPTNPPAKPPPTEQTTPPTKPPAEPTNPPTKPTKPPAELSPATAEQNASHLKLKHHSSEQTNSPPAEQTSPPTPPTNPPAKPPAKPPQAPVEVCLVNTNGELARLMQAANIAFIGKSLPPHTKGQNPFEAAHAALGIVYGDGMQHFKPIAEALEKLGGAIRVKGPAAVQKQVLELAQNTKHTKSLAAAASNWAQAQGGGTREALEHIEALLKRS